MVIDGTGIDHEKAMLDMTIQSRLDNIPALNGELSKYGVEIKEETRALPAMILRPSC